MNSWIGCGQKQNISYSVYCLKLTVSHGLCGTYIHEISRTRWVLHTVFRHQGTVAQHDHLTKNWVFKDLFVCKQALQKCERNGCISFPLKSPVLKCERQILGLTCLEMAHNLDVSCHQVHRCYQGRNSFRNRYLTRYELLFEEPDCSVSTDGRNGIK